MLQPDEAVRRAVHEYAERGVIRELSETRRGPRIDFGFLWLFDQRFRLRYDERADRLTFVDLVPEVRRGTGLYRDLKRFMAERTGREGGLPKHRIVDPKRAEVTLATRAGAASIVLQVKKRQRTYAVRRMLNLAHELFVFMRARHEEHLWRHFQLPQE